MDRDLNKAVPSVPSMPRNKHSLGISSGIRRNKLQVWRFHLERFNIAGIAGLQVVTGWGIDRDQEQQPTSTDSARLFSCLCGCTMRWMSHDFAGSHWIYGCSLLRLRRTWSSHVASCKAWAMDSLSTLFTSGLAWDEKKLFLQSRLTKVERKVDPCDPARLGKRQD